MYEFNLAIRFEKIAERYPQHLAIRFDQSTFHTFSELNRRANRLAHVLVGEGIGSRDIVCLSGRKTIETYSLMIACLKIGATYSIFDPDSPPDRLRKILATCRPALVVVDHDSPARFDSVFSELEVRSVDTGKLALLALESPDENLDFSREITGLTPAYIMFTSGSTGVPKGALIHHGGVLNLIDWARATYSIVPEEVFTNVNPLYFDNSVFDFYSSLFNGACLVPFTKEETRNPKTMVDKVASTGCTTWFSVPSMLIYLQTMKALDGRYLRGIKRFIFGGEGYPKAKLKPFFERYSDSAEFFNVSGPTECTCICSSHMITIDDFIEMEGFPTLGSLADNFSGLVLDPEGRRVENGEPGELCLLGPNVGLGYYNDPERTSKAFVQNPYNDSYREVMYKTGDLVRIDPIDGKLYILGRIDNQIKHMGYRIELEEIENALHRLDYVIEAVAVHSVRNGLSRIEALIACRAELVPERIREDLRSMLPDYMIPTAFIFDEVLPKNSNGKTDRQRVKEIFSRIDGQGFR